MQVVEYLRIRSIISGQDLAKTTRRPSTYCFAIIIHKNIWR